MTQLSFLSMGQAKKQLKRDRFLKAMDTVIPWSRFCDLVKPYYKDERMGRKRMPLERMLKIICLQQWYSLSDPAMEEEIYDRASFQKFLNLDLIHDPVPDETTILKFRHLLEEHDLFKALFEEIKKHLTEKGFLMKSGTIVDATLLSAPSSTKNQSGKRDPEMSSTKKSGEWHFGMKTHIGVDAESGLVHSITATTAKSHDSTEFENLLYGEEKIVFGDKAYNGKKHQRKFEKQGVAWGVLAKGTRSTPLTDTQKQRNRRLSSFRSKVEHPFQVIKCQWNYTKVRYRGIQKNLNQNYLLFGLYNLFKVRHKLRYI